MIAAFAAAAFFMSLAMTFAWAVQRRTGNAGWIDTVWSFAVGAAAFALALYPLPGEDGLDRAPVPRRRRSIALWAARLGGYIAIRSAGAPEDPAMPSW